MLPIITRAALQLLAAMCVCISGLAITTVSAELIQVPIASQASELLSVKRPDRGLSKAAVLADYGQAITVTAAVGEPPISRWEYEDYYVYFEYDHVIHTVLKHKPINLD